MGGQGGVSAAGGQAGLIILWRPGPCVWRGPACGINACGSAPSTRCISHSPLSGPVRGRRQACPWTARPPWWTCQSPRCQSQPRAPAKRTWSHVGVRKEVRGGTQATRCVGFRNAASKQRQGCPGRRITLAAAWCSCSSFLTASRERTAQQQSW